MASIYRLTANPDMVLLISENLQTGIYNKTPYPSYQEKWNVYEAWLAAGGNPDPHVPPAETLPPTLAERLQFMHIDLVELKALLN